MEFLMTYGWAILVVLAAIGALAYFGVLSPKNLLPSSCTVGAGFGCSNAKATADTLTLSMRQNLGEDLDYFNLTVIGDGTTCTAGTAISNWAVSKYGVAGNRASAVGFNYTLNTGATAIPLRTGKELARFDLSGCQFSGSASVDFTIEYRKSGETIWHSAQGKANLKVET